MQPSKQQALMFLLGAVLVGGALGFTADRMILNDRAGKPVDRRKDLGNLLTDRLSLTADQEQKINSILDERHRQYELVFAPARARYDSVKLSARSQMRAVLSEPQAVAFDALVRELNDSTRHEED